MYSPKEIERAKLMVDYCDAYEAANGYRPKISYERGRFRLKFNQSATTPMLREYTTRLWERAETRGDA